MTLMLTYKGDDMEACFKLYSDHPCLLIKEADGTSIKAHNKFFYENGWRDCLAMIANKQMDEKKNVELAYNGVQASL